MVGHDLTLGRIASDESIHDQHLPGLGLVYRILDRHLQFEPRMLELEIRKAIDKRFLTIR